MDLENKNKLVALKFQGYFAEDKGESPNSHQLKGWFLIRGKEIVSVKEKKNLSEITATTTLLPVKGGVELYDWDRVDTIANCFLQGIQAFCCSAVCI